VVADLQANASSLMTLETTIAMDIAYAAGLDPAQVQVDIEFSGGQATAYVTIEPDDSGAVPDVNTMTAIINSILDPSSPYHPPYTQPSTVYYNPIVTYRCGTGNWSPSCVPPPPPSSGTPLKYQGGFIAGMIIMCLVIAALVVFGAIWYLRHRKGAPKASSTDVQMSTLGSPTAGTGGAATTTGGTADPSAVAPVIAATPAEPAPSSLLGKTGSRFRIQSSPDEVGPVSPSHQPIAAALSPTQPEVLATVGAPRVSVAKEPTLGAPYSTAATSQ